MSKRYYYQWSANGLSDQMEAWQIFDRDITEKNGEVGAIFLCRSREWARKITTYLNMMEPR